MSVLGTGQDGEGGGGGGNRKLDKARLDNPSRWDSRQCRIGKANMGEMLDR